MKCLIVAAGEGCRLKSKGECKPLLSFLGRPLIEWVIERGASAGVDGFLVVTGFHGRRLGAFLQQLSARTGWNIETVHNPEWRKQNGISVLAAKPYMKEEFLLAMADHLFDPAGIEAMLQTKLPSAGVVLAVDRDLANPAVDLDDVTRVRTDEENIIAIGKGLVEFDAFDTGLFKCSPAIFDGIDLALRSRGDASLSDGMTALIGERLAFVTDFKGDYWIDVDDPRMYQTAEQIIQAAERVQLAAPVT